MTDSAKSSLPVSLQNLTQSFDDLLINKESKAPENRTLVRNSSGANLLKSNEGAVASNGNLNNPNDTTQVQSSSNGTTAKKTGQNEEQDVDAIASMDSNIDKMLEEMKRCLISRNEDGNVAQRQKYKLPLISERTMLHLVRYKEHRQMRLSDLLATEIRPETNPEVQAIESNLDHSWQIHSELQDESLTRILRDFYFMKANELLERNHLVLSRWARFCKTSAHLAKLHTAFMRYEESFSCDYVDAVERYERLCDAIALKELTAEKGGTNNHQFIADAMTHTPPKRSPAFPSPPPLRTAAGARLTKQSNEAYHPGQDADWRADDIVVLLRHLSGQLPSTRLVNQFKLRVQLWPQTDRTFMIDEYARYSQCLSLVLTDEEIRRYGNPQLLRGIAPLKRRQIEHFIDSFSKLTELFNIQTDLEVEDGRAFAYECNNLFASVFEAQNRTMQLISAENLAALRRAAKTEEDEDAQAVEETARLLKQATWLNDIKIFAKLPAWQEEQNSILGKKKEVDFELRYELDCATGETADFCLQRMQDRLKRMVEENGHHLTGRTMVLSQDKQDEVPSANNNIFTGEGIDSHQVIGARSATESIQSRGEAFVVTVNKISASEYYLNGDGEDEDGSTRHNSHSICELFNEHEMFAFLQLRTLKLRESRDTLLSYLNFFRSIEKRLNLDHLRRESIRKDGFDTKAEPAQSMKLDGIFALPRPTGSTKKDFARPEQLNFAKYLDLKSVQCNDDIRTMVEDKMILRDEDNVPYVYDVAMQDLALLENELLKIATHYINENAENRTGGNADDYIGQMKYKIQSNKNDPNVMTYLNPKVDRADVLMDIYSCENRFQATKMMLVNMLMEIYEHATNTEQQTTLAQSIVNVIATRPMLNLDGTYFCRNYVLHTKALECQCQLMEETYHQIVKEQREWRQKYDPRNMARSIHGDNAEQKAAATHLTSFSAGLPRLVDAYEAVNLHHVGIEPIDILDMFEYVEEAVMINDAITKVIDQFVNTFTANVHQQQHHSCERIFVECYMRNRALKVWRQMMSNGVNGNKTIIMDDHLLLENPYLPDVLLEDQYNEFLKTRALEVQPSAQEFRKSTISFYNDLDFQPLARQWTCNYLKMFIMRQRLIHNYVESEELRKCCQEQSLQMNLTSEYQYHKLRALTFDETLTQMTLAQKNNKDLLDEDEEDPRLQGETDGILYDSIALREMDNKTPLFEVTRYESFVSLLDDMNIRHLLTALKIQILEKNTLLTAVRVNNILLSEVYFRLYLPYKEDYYHGTMNRLVQQLRKGLKNPFTFSEPELLTVRDLMRDREMPEYKDFIFNPLPRKKMLRRLMIAEYTMKLSELNQKDLSDQELHEQMMHFKFDLFDWYYRNMADSVMECAEKVAMTQVIQSLRAMTEHTWYGKFIFKMSDNGLGLPQQQQRKSKQEDEIRTNNSNKLDLNDIVTQEVVDNGSVLFEMWHLPTVYESLLLPLTEGITKFNDSSSLQTQASFRQMNFIYEVLLDVVQFNTYMSLMLHMNKKFALQSVKTAKEHDYAVHIFTSLKKDLCAMGSTIEYTQLESYLRRRWEILVSKYRLTLERTLDQAIKFEDYHCVHLLQRKLTFAQRDPTRSLPGYFETSLRVRDTIHQRLSFVQQTLTDVDEKFRKIFLSKFLEIDHALDQFGGQQTVFNDAVNDTLKLQLEYLQTTLKIIKLRRVYMAHVLPTAKKDVDHPDYYELYRVHILQPAVQLYFRYGAKGNGTESYLLRNEWLNDTTTNAQAFNKIVQVQFDKCLLTVLQEELSRVWMNHFQRQVSLLSNMLADERLGYLFRLNNTIDVSAQVIANDEKLDNRVNESDHHSKSAMMVQLLNDFAASEEALPESSRSSDKNVFNCSRESLYRCLNNHASSLAKWHQIKMKEQHHFGSVLYGHVMNLIQQKEEALQHQQYLLDLSRESFERRVRVAGAEACTEIHVQLATTNVELNEMKKARRLDERKIRARVAEDYNELVGELSMQVHVLKNRFNEYRSNLFQETLGIMSESKMEQLQLALNKIDMPPQGRALAEQMESLEQRLQELAEENFELKMAISKMRSMHAIKDVALRGVFERKIKKLTEEAKRAEEKLWECYRDSDARERILRKQLTKCQKELGQTESEVEQLRRQLKDEQRNKQNMTRVRQAEDARTKELLDRISRLEQYEGVDVDHLLTELAAKEKQLEALKKEEARRKALSSAKESRQRTMSRSERTVYFATKLQELLQTGPTEAADASSPQILTEKDIVEQAVQFNASLLNRAQHGGMSASTHRSVVTPLPAVTFATSDTEREKSSPSPLADSQTQTSYEELSVGRRLLPKQKTTGIVATTGNRLFSRPATAKSFESSAAIRKQRALSSAASSQRPRSSAPSALSNNSSPATRRKQYEHVQSSHYGQEKLLNRDDPDFITSVLRTARDIHNVARRPKTAPMQQRPLTARTTLRFIVPE